MDLGNGPPPKLPGQRRRSNHSGTPHARGYVKIMVARHPTYLHRLVMESLLGRLLLPGEDVHHRDGHPRNDLPSNLELLGHWRHSRNHGPNRPLVSNCLLCGHRFPARHRCARPPATGLVAQRFRSRLCAQRHRRQAEAALASAGKPAQAVHLASTT
jgi:hypothetical protein